jgi:hypothetical protein
MTFPGILTTIGVSIFLMLSFLIIKPTVDGRFAARDINPPPEVLEPQPVVYDYPDYYVTLSGIYDACAVRLPATDVEECREGIRLPDGRLFVFTFEAGSSTLQRPQAFETVTLSGLVTPTERFSTDIWRNSGVSGIFTSLDSLQILVSPQ